MFETVHQTWEVLLAKGAHIQSLENHYLTTFGATQIDNQNVGENWVRDDEISGAAVPMNDAYDNQGMVSLDFVCKSAD